MVFILIFVSVEIKFVDTFLFIVHDIFRNVLKGMRQITLLKCDDEKYTTSIQDALRLIAHN